MSGRRTNSRKRDALRKQGSLNRYPEQVTDSLFQQSDFFDANDLVQVKYEMLRHVQIDHQPVSQAAAAFGFSRPTYYQAELDFQDQGLFGLIPEKRGPRRAHKLTPEVLEACEYRARIPMAAFDSLNVASAAAIALYELGRHT